MPTAAGWADLADLLERTRRGLAALYAYWEANEELVGHVLRDAEAEPTVRRARLGSAAGRIRAALLAGSADGELAATVDLALSFRTWQSLRSGLATSEAVDLMARLVGCAR